MITDLTMPTMTGADLPGAFMRYGPTFRLFLITGHNGNLELDSVRKFGIREILIKPQPLEILAASVHRALSVTKGNDEDNPSSR